MFKSEGEMKSFESKREMHKENEDQGPLRNITGRIRHPTLSHVILYLAIIWVCFPKAYFIFIIKDPTTQQKQLIEL